MSITLNDGTVLRNLEEQVQYLTNFHNENQALASWGIRIVGQVLTPSELPTDYVGEYGDAYAVGSAAPYSYYIWTRAGGPELTDYWFDFGEISIVGPQGPEGPQGPIGPTGESTKWYAGNELPPAALSKYVEGDMYLNNSEGLVFRFENGRWNPVINIKGPMGTQGIRGPQGERGPQGIQGPMGPRGYNGGFVNIIGTVPTTSALPDPETLNNLTLAYLVGTAAPYALYVQVGTNPVTASWYNMGTAANTEGFVKATNAQNKVYVHDHEKDTTIGYTTSAQGGAFPIRDWDGNIYLPTDSSKYTENSAVPKSYVDGKSAGIYQHNIVYMKLEPTAGPWVSFMLISTDSTRYTLDSYGMKFYNYMDCIGKYFDGSTTVPVFVEYLRYFPWMVEVSLIKMDGTQIHEEWTVSEANFYDAVQQL